MPPPMIDDKIFRSPITLRASGLAPAVELMVRDLVNNLRTEVENGVRGLLNRKFGTDERILHVVSKIIVKVLAPLGNKNTLVYHYLAGSTPTKNVVTTGEDQLDRVREHIDQLLSDEVAFKKMVDDSKKVAAALPGGDKRKKASA